MYLCCLVLNVYHEYPCMCVWQKRVPGADGFPHIIGGSDLLVHNRGKDSDVDEWLKDAAEVFSLNFFSIFLVIWNLWFKIVLFQEERQNRRDEAIGDDLFRWV